MQPNTYLINPTGALSRYGTAIYGISTYSGRTKFNEKLSIDGSGYSNTFTFSSTGTGDPYNLDSMYIDLRVGPKL
jgi:hypothetical protein